MPSAPGFELCVCLCVFVWHDSLFKGRGGPLTGGEGGMFVLSKGVVHSHGGCIDMGGGGLVGGLVAHLLG